MQMGRHSRFALSIAVLAFAVAVPVLVNGFRHPGAGSIRAGDASFGSIVLVAPWLLQLLYLAWLVPRLRDRAPDPGADAIWLGVLALSGMIALAARQVEPISGSWAAVVHGLPVSTAIAAVVLICVHVVVFFAGPAVGLRVTR